MRRFITAARLGCGGTLHRTARQHARAQGASVAHAPMRAIAYRLAGLDREPTPQLGCEAAATGLAPISFLGRFKELDRIVGGVIEEYLLAAHIGHPLVAISSSGRPEARDVILKVCDLDLNPVRAPRRRLVRPSGIG